MTVTVTVMEVADDCGAARREEAPGRRDMPQNGWGLHIRDGEGRCRLHGGSIPDHVKHAAEVALME